jgi:ornithine decarboxylase
LSCLNVGGGFPAHYPHENLPPLTHFFDAIQKTTLSAFRSSAPLICCEPGRAMVAPTTSLLMQVKLVRADQNDLFLNDGVYGGFLEPTQVPVMPPVRLIRHGKIVTDEPLKKMTAYGPTCDPIDTLPAPVSLPKSVCEGDFLEFGFMGAYSTATATRFNGYGKIELTNVQNVFQGGTQGAI